MKVLYIISNPFYYSLNPVGGSISSGTGVIESLNKKGFSIDILTDDKLPTVETSDSINYIYFNNLLVRRFLFSLKKFVPDFIHRKLSGIFFQLSILFTLPKILKEEDYEFIYTRASHYASDILYFVKRKNLKSILEVNKPLSMQSYNKKAGFDELKKSEIPQISKEIKQYEYCTMISVDSTLRARWIKEYVDSKFEHKILINHNGVNEALFSPVQTNLESNIVGMASSFRWYNDIDELMRIILKVVFKRQDVVFRLFIGDLGKKQEIEARILSYNLEGSVSLEFEIPLLKMPSKLSQCDILVSHFNFHGVWPHNCSIKHLEYMALSKPVVATNVGEVNFAIRHGHNGLLVEEGDETSFAEAILNLLNNKDYAIQLGKNGRDDILAKHTWDRHVDDSLKEIKLYETNK